MNQLFFKVKQHAHGKTYDIFYGDPNNIESAKYLGHVGQVVDGINRPTGTWCYTMNDEKQTMNWKAGKSFRQAAVRLAHKNGVAKDVKA